MALTETGVNVVSPNMFATGAYVVDLVVHADTPPTAFAQVGDPRRPDGTVAGAVVSRDAGALSYGPVLFTTATGGTVSVAAHTGQFVYTPSDQARTLARTSADPAAKTDSFTATVTDAYGRCTEVPVAVEILAANVPPKAAAKIRRPDVNGVVRGRIEATACDGGEVTYSLANSANPVGSTAESAYSDKRGVVQLDTASGQFIFIPAISTAIIPDLDTDRFVVTVVDAQGATVDVTVKTFAHLAIDTQTTGTAPDTQSGRLSISGDEEGPIRFALGTPPLKGTAHVSSNGTYVYTRRPDLGSRVSAADTFSIVGTDHFGRSLTVATVTVCPPLATTRPVGTTCHVESSLNAAGEQISRGRINPMDAHGDPLIFTGGSMTSAKGSTVIVEADGAFVYSSAGNAGVGHRAAAVDAVVADKVDTFTVSAANWLGRVSEIVVRVDVLAHNSMPTVSTVGGSGRKRAATTGEWTTTVSDADGDAITYRVIQDNPWGTVSVRRDSARAFVVTYTSTSPKVGRFHPRETFAIRYYDGHVASDGTAAYITTIYAF